MLFLLADREGILSLPLLDARNTLSPPNSPTCCKLEDKSSGHGTCWTFAPFDEFQNHWHSRQLAQAPSLYFTQSTVMTKRVHQGIVCMEQSRNSSNQTHLSTPLHIQNTPTALRHITSRLAELYIEYQLREKEI